MRGGNDGGIVLASPVRRVTKQPQNRDDLGFISWYRGRVSMGKADRFGFCLAVGTLSLLDGPCFSIDTGKLSIEDFQWQRGKGTAKRGRRHCA